jgi:hypothetical protein
LKVSRTSLIRLAGFACKLALFRSCEGKSQAVIVNAGPLAKIKISHSDIANNLPKTLRPFNIVSVNDILNKRIPGVLKGGMVVTGYSDKFLCDDLKIRKIPRENLRNDDRSIDSKIQSCIRTVSIVQKEDFEAGRSWFLILSETLPHLETFKSYCWWGNGPFVKDWSVAEIRYSGREHDNINLINFKNDTNNKWVKTKMVSFSTRMLD